MAEVALGRRPLRLRKIRELARKGRFTRSTANWFTRFYFARRDDDWYASLMEPPPGMVSGEICHAYSGMSVSQLRAMRDGFPDLKLIFLVREPVSRCWSGLARKLASRDGISIDPSWSTEDVIALMHSVGAIEKSCYAQSINRVLTVFPKKNLYIGFFDQLRDDPLTFLDDLCRWLDLEDYQSAVGLSLPPKIGGASYPPMPAELRAALVGEFEDVTKQLFEIVPDPRINRWNSDLTRSHQ